ncbi:MAG: family 10 glycosylhydrolase [Candidatus Hydrogenedentes bacterium]|nr:family 10 glycosylhydrolase [Candidatus Hydrogenedentota bacterium]
MAAIVSVSASPAFGATDIAVVAADGSQRAVDWENTTITTDALVRYTPAWGPQTPDNRWTHSVIVQEGEVVETVPGGAAGIPDDGVVLTGHGDAAAWLRAHLKQGAAVQFRRKEPFAEERFEREADKVDPDGIEFPSGRGTDELVVYTPAFGERTGTNIFGSEAVVRQGRIVERTGGDSPIPADGFIVSGHGRASAWIMLHCEPGSRVERNGLRLTVIRDREARFDEVEAALRHAEQRIAQCDARGAAYAKESVQTALREAGDALARARVVAGEDPHGAAALCRKARRAAWTACARASTTRPVEARGVWIGGASQIADAAARRAYLGRLAEANINMVLPLIGPILSHESGEELLRDFISDAHEFGVEVHVWTWLPGHSIPRSADAERLAEHPDWADVSSSGKVLATLDPANPAVREALVADAVWLVTTFDVHGLHMDWEGFHGGFSETSRAAFRATHGYDPLGEAGPRGAARTRDVYLWRVSLIDRIVAEVAEAVREARPEVLLSSAVQCFNLHPNIPSDRGASHQWIRWIVRGQLDAACPMIYAQNTEFVGREARTMTHDIDKRALHYAGLILYPETAQCGLIEPYQLLEQIDVVREAGCDGVILFAGNQLFTPPATPDDRLLLALKEGPFREKAAVPHREWQHRPIEPEATVPYLHAEAAVQEAPDEVAPRADATVRIRVKNHGTEPFRISGVGLSAPHGWHVRLGDTPAGPVETDSTATVQAILEVPAGAEDGTVEVTLKVTLIAGTAEKSVSVPAFACRIEAADAR